MGTTLRRAPKGNESDASTRQPIYDPQETKILLMFAQSFECTVQFDIEVHNIHAGSMQGTEVYSLDILLKISTHRSMNSNDRLFMIVKYS